MPSDALAGALEPGARLDAYELLGLVAHGGMANVWVARQRMKHGLETMVAVKTILPELSLDPAFQAMFLDEARIACRVDHANVARLLDVGEARGHAYIVMEYVAGESLSRLRRTFVRDGALVPLAVALRVTSDLCAALHAAHELTDVEGQPLRVVHRDVSPQNVLLSDSGVVKLIDFGVAKARDRFAAETSAGFAKGKARYMAPEQSEGGPIDRRADVWGAGAVLYELVAGRTPFDGPNDAAIFRALLAGTAPVDRLPSTVPEPVRVLVHRALERSPEARFPTARAMRDAIEDAMDALGLKANAVTIERLCAGKLGDRIAERRRQLDVWMRAAAAREEPGARDATPGASGLAGPISVSVGTVAAVTVPADGPEDRSTVSVTHEPAPAAGPSRRSRGRTLVWASVAALAVAAAGGVFVTRAARPLDASGAAMQNAPASASSPYAPSAALSVPPPPASVTRPTAAASVETPPSATPGHRPPRMPPGHAPHVPAAPSGHDWGGIQ